MGKNLKKKKKEKGDTCIDKIIEKKRPK